MSSLMSFADAEGHNVRSVIINGEPWFVAKDVADVLGIRKYRDALASLEPEERMSATVDTLGGPQKMAMINEAGIYGFMLISPSDLARRFRKWLTQQVLPTIRQYGMYTPELAKNLELSRFANPQNQKEANKAVAKRLFDPTHTPEAIIAHNKANCVAHTGREPKAYVKAHAQQGKRCTSFSAREVARRYGPELACSMALADDLCAKGATMDQLVAAGFAKTMPAAFQTLLAVGLTPEQLGYREGGRHA